MWWKLFWPVTLRARLDIEDVDRDLFRSELGGGSRQVRIDREPLAVDVGPAGRDKCRTADVLLVANSEHRAAVRRDPEFILAGAVMAAEEGDLLTRFDVAIGAVLGQTADLRSSCRGYEGKRRGAQ